MSYRMLPELVLVYDQLIELQCEHRRIMSLFSSGESMRMFWVRYKRYCVDVLSDRLVSNAVVGMSGLNLKGGGFTFSSNL